MLPKLPGDAGLIDGGSLTNISDPRASTIRRCWLPPIPNEEQRSSAKGVLVADTHDTRTKTNYIYSALSLPSSTSM